MAVNSSKNPFRVDSLLSTLVLRLLDYLSLPMAILGGCTEYVLNLLRLNGGILNTLLSIMTGKVIVPRTGTEKFYSAVGLLDYRFDLYEDINEEMLSTNQTEAGKRFFADLCVMASKIAYENALVIKQAVTNHWKMHFLEFFDFWNAKLKRKATQAFMFSDREEDARLVVIAFRGTEPFIADDWKTDFDFSPYEWEGVGKVHVGFLEALGLAKRQDVGHRESLLEALRLAKRQDAGEGDGDSLLEALGFSKFRYSNSTKQSLYVSPLLLGTSPSFARRRPIELDDKHSDVEKPLAFYVLVDRLIQILETHKNAKFIVTGHSLGGALATLFAGIVCGSDDRDLKNRKGMLMERLFAVYTFGQPRVGDLKFARFLDESLNKPYPRYFRVVYSHDIVPKLPFDDDIFNYKHFGSGLYFNCFYREKNLAEEPSEEAGPNFWVDKARHFFTERVTASWELLGALVRPYLEGKEYKECKLSILFRIFGLVLPGVSAHSPVNYVNSVRLGPPILQLPPPTPTL